MFFPVSFFLFFSVLHMQEHEYAMPFCLRTDATIVVVNTYHGGHEAWVSSIGMRTCGHGGIGMSETGSGRMSEGVFFFAFMFSPLSLFHLGSLSMIQPHPACECLGCVCCECASRTHMHVLERKRERENKQIQPGTGQEGQERQEGISCSLFFFPSVF